MDISKCKIIVEKTHTDEMLKGEIKSMLKQSDVLLTLGSIMRLFLLDSPYLKGGSIDESDLVKAYDVVKHKDEMPYKEFHFALLQEIESAWRVYEIVVPDEEKKAKIVSEIALFSPEWAADLIAGASRALPSMTYDDILFNVPFITLVHLSISSGRYNGVITRRPDDTKEALRQLKLLNEKELKDNE